MSISYGDDEANQGTAAMEAENSILAQLTGEGITVGGTGFAANQLFDIIEGTNGLPPALSFGNPGFSAGYAYDNCTGNGSLWGANFFPQLAATYVSPLNGPGGVNNVNVVAKATSAVATWDAVAGATGYIVQLVDLDLGFVYPRGVCISQKRQRSNSLG